MEALKPCSFVVLRAMAAFADATPSMKPAADSDSALWLRCAGMVARNATSIPHRLPSQVLLALEVVLTPDLQPGFATS